LDFSEGKWFENKIFSKKILPNQRPFLKLELHFFEQLNTDENQTI